MTVPISRTLRRRREIEVPLAEAEVSQFHLLLDRGRAVLKVEFTDTDGRLADMEGWVLRGQVLNQALNRAPSGGSNLASLRDNLNWIVNRIENVEGLKEQLQGNGQLRVVKNPRVLFDD